MARRRGRPSGLTWQVAALAGGAAAVTAILAAALALTLVRGPAQAQTQATLRREAVLVARILDSRAAGSPNPRRATATRVLDAVKVSIARVQASGRVTGAAAASVTPADVASLLDGQAISGVRHPGGGDVVVDGEPLLAGGAVVLSEPVAQARALDRPLLRRAALALLIAVALAVAVGALVARRITRPLRAVAGNAHALAAGDRGRPVATGGSAEVVEVAEALNALDTALQTAEQRQRDFLLSVSHELRTPLTTIRGYAESWEDGVTSDGRAVASVIVGEAQRMERLVGDLLALARLQADRFPLVMGSVDAADLVGQARAAWRPRCVAAGLTLAGDGPPPGTTVSADPDRLRQVLDVLLENALRLTPSPGTIRLEGALGTAGLALSVSDTGPGLTTDDLAVAFVPGALHARYAGRRPVGSGVGLALAAELTTRLGGRLVAAQDPGGGARFTVHLPTTGQTRRRDGSAAGAEPLDANGGRGHA